MTLTGITINTGVLADLMKILIYQKLTREISYMDKIADNLPNDLAEIFNKKTNTVGGWYRLSPNGKFVEVPILDEESLMQELVIYITARDHKIWDHAFNLGKEKNVGQNQ